MVKKLSGKLAFLLAVVMATMVGGITTAVVMAAIPDANGQITACRRTNNGDTRIIDTATESCNGNEAAINWSQGGASDGAQAYAYIESLTDTPSIRSGFSEHIASAQTSPVSTEFTCVEFDNTVANPKQVLISGVGTIDPPTGTLAIVDPALASSFCPAGTDVVVSDGSGSSLYMRVY